MHRNWAKTLRKWEETLKLEYFATFFSQAWGVHRICAEMMRFSAPSIGWGSRRAWRKPFWTWTENLWPSSAPMLGSTDWSGRIFSGICFDVLNSKPQVLRWHALVLRIVPAAACSWPCWWAVNSLWDSWEVVEPYSVKVGKKGEDYKSHWLLRRLMKAAKG